jgi:hypothetical protein
LLSDTVKEDKVKDDVKQAYLAYLFFIDSNNKKHSQLEKTVANDHAKRDREAFPSSCHAALTLMNDFKPLDVKATAPVASQGTAFAQKQQKGAGTHAVIIRSTLPTRSATTVVRRAILQNVTLRRKARQRRVLMM